MRILDRYIIKQFLINFAILFAVLMLLFILIDFIVNMRSFVDGGRFQAQRWLIHGEAQSRLIDADLLKELVDDEAAPARYVSELNLSSEAEAQDLMRSIRPGPIVTSAGVIWSLVDYYGPVALLIYVFFSGLIVTASMGFTLTGFLRNRELTAMLASGVSMYRIAAPVIVAGAALSAVNLPLQEFVIPRLTQKLTRDKRDLARDRQRAIAIYFAQAENGTLLSASRLDGANLEGVTILERDVNHLIKRRISAARATWIESRKAWQLHDGYAESPVSIDGTIIDLAQGKPEPYSFFETELSPPVLHTLQQGLYQHLLPIGQLQDLANKPAIPAGLKSTITRTIWSRLSLVVLNVLVLIMGLPFFMLRMPGNMLTQSIKAVGVCVGAWAGGVMLLQVSGSVLQPVVASWLPVVIFLPVSAGLLQLIKS